MENIILASLQATYFPIILFFLTLLLLKWYLHFKNDPSTKKPQPPSPPRLPILGNLHQVGAAHLHETFESMAKRYGPLMLLHFGSAPAFIVSSAEVAEEILKTHDLDFSNRIESIISRKIMYDAKDVIMAPHGEYWKIVRGLCASQFLSSTRVQSQQRIRDEETALMVERIKEYDSSPFDLNTQIEKISIDIMCRASLGRKVDKDEGTSQRHLIKLIEEFNSLFSVFNIADYVPWLGWINHFNGLYKRIERNHHDIDQFFEKIISGQTERDHGHIGEEKLLLDVLLEAQNVDGSKITRDSVKGVLLDMYTGGIDTTVTTMGWTMAELMRHPEVLEKVQREIREVVGDKKQITIQELKKMNYLKAAIREAMRLHPPFPILPRVSGTEEVEVQGYTIPAKTRILINIWAIGRDPASWENPDEFRPERFLFDGDDNPTLYSKAHGFNWMPFGGGRRGCPGVLYGTVLVEQVLATLLLNFNLSLPEGTEVGDIDMAEFVAFSLHRMHPLIVVASPHNNS